MSDIPPPLGPREYIEVGGNLEPLEPTPYLIWQGGVLHQWCSATRNDKSTGAIHQKGEWRAVRHS